MCNNGKMLAINEASRGNGLNLSMKGAGSMKIAMAENGETGYQ
jgi:hypothetical protein